MDCTTDSAGVCSGEPPAVAPRGPHGVAWLVGTPVSVWQVVEGFERQGSIPALAAALGLSEHQVRVALEYFERRPGEIERDRHRARRPVTAPRAARS